MPATSTENLLRLYGRIYTNEFQEDLSDTSVEYFQRLLVGGRACDAMDENGTL